MKTSGDSIFLPVPAPIPQLQLEWLQQLGLISGPHINPLVPGVGISWTQSTNFCKFVFFFFKPFLSVFQGSGERVWARRPIWAANCFKGTQQLRQGKAAQTALVLFFLEGLLGSPYSCPTRHLLSLAFGKQNPDPHHPLLS